MEHFVPTNAESSEFLGVIGGDVVSVVCPHFPLVGRHLRVSSAAAAAPPSNIAYDVSAFSSGDKVEDALRSLAGKKKTRPFDPDRAVAVLERLHSIGFSHVASISDDCTEIALVSDGSRLDVRLPGNFPQRDGVVTADSPHIPAPIVAKVEEESGGGDTIARVFRRFVEQKEMFEPVRLRLSELDEDAWVIDPEHSTGKELHRRIVLSREVQLMITLDAANADDLPDFKFMGPDSKVGPMRQNLVDNARLFSGERSLARNVEMLLELELPRPQEVVKDEFNLECCICYGERLGDRELLPNKVCDNPRCCKRFHEQCLFDWLNTLPGNQVKFDMLTGDCPMCETRISCRVPC